MKMAAYFFITVLIGCVIFLGRIWYLDHQNMKYHEMMKGQIEFRGYKAFDDAPYYLEYRVGEDCYDNRNWGWKKVEVFKNDDSPKHFTFCSGTYNGPGMSYVQITSKDEVDEWRKKYPTRYQFEMFVEEQDNLYSEYVKEEQNKRTL